MAIEFKPPSENESPLCACRFLIFLSFGVLSRPFCLFEIECALSQKKPVMLLHETDKRHGAFDFAGDEVKAAPEAIASLFMTHESLRELSCRGSGCSLFLARPWLLSAAVAKDR